MNTLQWVAAFLTGKFSSYSTKVQIEAGWYDWFCEDKHLLNKTLKMGNIISKIKPGGKVDLINTYVWFKNNFPLQGPMYDSFRISDIKTGTNLFVVNIDSPYENHKYAVYSNINNYKTPVFVTGDARKLVTWFNKK